MKNKEKSISELTFLKNNLLEYKKNMKIGGALTVAGLVADIGITNLQIKDLSVLSLATTLVTVPATMVTINYIDYRRDKKRIKDINEEKTLKKEYK